MNRVLPFSVVIGIAIGPSLLYAQPPGRGGPPGMRGGGPPTEMIIQLFTQADANSDGSVTKAELTAVLQNQGRGSQRGPGGPPPQRGNFGQGEQQANQKPPAGEGGGHGAHHGPPPQPGQVLPEPIAQSLNLNARQTRMIAALQADVDKRLAAILTDEQQVKFKSVRPPRGPDHVDAGNERPQRPQ